MIVKVSTLLPPGNQAAYESGGMALVNSQNAVKSALARTVVVIPMLNEEASIAMVLQDLPDVQRVIVVDNGCTDQSPQIARENNALVVKEPVRGYGAACLAGIATIREMARQRTPPEIVLFIDGDYSDHGEEAGKVIAPIVEEQFDFVVGSRMLGEREKGAMPFQAVFGNWLACTLMRILWGGRFTDLGPFRAIRWNRLLELEMQDRNFGWTVEMQIKAIQKKLRYIEVPVAYRRRVGASKISGTVSGTVRAGYKILFTIFRYRIRRSPTRK